MNNKLLYLLLQVIKNNGNVKKLTREGLSFSDVADLTNSALNENIISFDDNNELVLTKIGEEKFLLLHEEVSKINKEDWIDFENKSKTNKLDKNFIYLPNPNDLSILDN